MSIFARLNYKYLDDGSLEVNVFPGDDKTTSIAAHTNIHL